MRISEKWKKTCQKHHLGSPENCRHIKFYNDEQGGERLTLWHRPNHSWERRVLQYHDILAYQGDGFLLEFVMREGGILLAGWNMLTLTLLLEKRVIRSIRTVPEWSRLDLESPLYQGTLKEVTAKGILPLEMVFSETESIFAPPKTVPDEEVLH